MRLEITLPDGLYSEAQSAATARGLSLDRYMADLLKVHLRAGKSEPVLKLSPEQIEFIRQGQTDALAGNVLTLEQLDELSAADKAAWREESRV